MASHRICCCCMGNDVIFLEQEHEFYVTPLIKFQIIALHIIIFLKIK